MTAPSRSTGREPFFRWSTTLTRPNVTQIYDSPGEPDMNANQLKAQIVPLLHLAGLVLVIVAALKYGGVRVSFGGNVTETAMVGIGLLLAR
jgi:hypothetical protein